MNKRIFNKRNKLPKEPSELGKAAVARLRKNWSKDVVLYPHNQELERDGVVRNSRWANQQKRLERQFAKDALLKKQAKRVRRILG